MTSNKALSSYKPAMLLLGVVVSIALLTGMTDHSQEATKGHASLVNKYGDPMQIASMKNAGRLCVSQVELEYGSDLVESTLNRDDSVFVESAGMYKVSLSASVGTSSSWEALNLDCEVMSNNITVSALTIR